MTPSYMEAIMMFEKQREAKQLLSQFLFTQALFPQAYRIKGQSFNTVSYDDMVEGEKPMICDWIKEKYPRTEDADLVIKWFPHLNSHDPWGGFLVGDRTEELLELAKKLEAESKEK